MPAFDFTSFLVQSVWVSVGFIGFYIIVLKLILPNLFFAIRLSDKIYLLKK